MHKLLLLINPLLEERRAGDLRRILAEFWHQGVEVSVEKTGANRSAGQRAKQAAAEGVDAVLACGGDGTVFDILQGMAGSSLPLGIVPFGTGNVLAQNLAIPNEPAAMARWVLSSGPLLVPLGRVTCCPPGVTTGPQSWYFAMSAGMGMHAALMRAARVPAKRTRGRAAYYWAGARLLLWHPLQPFDVEITTVDRAQLRRRVCEAVALRVPELNLWRPGGALTSPFLRLVTVEGHSRWGLLRSSLGVLARSLIRPGRRRPPDRGPIRYEDVIRVVCRPIPGRQYRAALEVEADGEVLDFPGVTIEMAGVSVNLLAHPS